jgi:O-antigen ligase
LVASKGGIIISVMVFFFHILTTLRSKTLAVAICLAVVAISTIIVSKSQFLKTRFVVSTTFEYGNAWAGNWNSTSQRLAIWSCAFETINNNFPWGNGTGDGEPELYKTYRKNNYIRGYEDGLNPHNEFLFTWLDLGILGVMVLLAVVCIPLYLSIRMKEKIYLYTLISVVMFFLFEVVLTRRFGVNFLSFVYGLMAVDYFNFVTKEQDANV